jgi:hypothetical protein
VRRTRPSAADQGGNSSPSEQLLELCLSDCFGRARCNPIAPSSQLLDRHGVARGRLLHLNFELGSRSNVHPAVVAQQRQVSLPKISYAAVEPLLTRYQAFPTAISGIGKREAALRSRPVVHRGRTAADDVAGNAERDGHAARRS